MGDDGDDSNEGTVRERLTPFDSADTAPASPDKPLPSQNEEDPVQASDGSASTSEQPAVALSQDGFVLLRECRNCSQISRTHGPQNLQRTLRGAPCFGAARTRCSGTYPRFSARPSPTLRRPPPFLPRLRRPSRLPPSACPLEGVVVRRGSRLLSGSLLACTLVATDSPCLGM